MKDFWHVTFDGNRLLRAPDVENIMIEKYKDDDIYENPDHQSSDEISENYTKFRIDIFSRFGEDHEAYADEVDLAMGPTLAKQWKTSQGKLCQRSRWCTRR